MYKKILSPVDGSETSDHGMMEAIRLAKDQKAQLRFVYVVDALFATIDPSMTNVADLIELLHQDGERVLERAKECAREQGVDADSKILEAMGGRIGDFIVQAAESWPASLIVMGTHGRRGISRLFMGSDAQVVVRTSPVPVLLVRIAGEPEK